MSTDRTNSRESSFLDTGLDWSTDVFTTTEKDRLLAWYAHNHDTSTQQLSRFAAHMIEHDPGGFKRYRRHILAIDIPRDGAVLPQGAHLLFFLHAYVSLGYEKGILYAIVNLRQLGASRGEILDTLRLAAITGGPFGMNATAELSDQYLREWPADADGTGLSWPTGWVARPEVFRAGIDASTDDLLDGEVERIASWNRAMFGEVPGHVDALAELHPRAYKTQRIRFEGATGGSTLPAHMVPLCQLLLAAVRLWPKPMLRATQMARTLGVDRHHVVETLCWAAVYGGDVVLETAFDAVGDVLRDWS